MSKLNSRKCPVCGNKIELEQIESDPDEGPGMGWESFQVVCDWCGACGPYLTIGSYNDRKKYAIDGWNKLIGAVK